MATLCSQYRAEKSGEACHQSKAFEESVDEAIDALKRQIDKFKSKSEK